MLSVSRNVTAPTSAESATTEPMDRSISPAASTKTSPTAMIVIGAVWMTMLVRLLVVRKPLLPWVMAKNRNTTAKPM